MPRLSLMGDRGRGPGVPIAVYHIMNTYGVHPDGALLENVAVKYHLREQ